ncbi:MAG: DUF711 family protein [Kouleothrix sp.]|nr:DUF711 family protein [Kouleothrix sp.]
MEIRTITAGAREEDLGRAARAAQLARARLEAAGYTVQTLRVALATSGFNSCGDFATIARAAEQQALDAGFDYVSIGPVEGDRLAALPDAIAATQALFASAQIAAPDGAVRPENIRAAASAIAAIGAGTPDGFGNLRFAASACVAAGSPFFPAAYHDGGAPWVAVGPEAAALAVEATQPLADGETRRQGDKETNDRYSLSPGLPVSLPGLTALIEQHDARIVAALQGLAAETGARFAGCDWSLAPHPDPARSVGAAAEALGGVPFGAWGTLAAVRGLTAAIRAARVTQLGFSGVMLPVLEDATLARRNAEGRYTLRDLLAFSAVCGTGLDTIPLPGDTTPEQIAGVLAEVAALASALRKPLTARLLPVPGLRAGDMTAFDFPYFVNTRVMEIA